MRILLDTKAFLWAETGERSFRQAVGAILEDPNNERIVSAATSWEIAIKYGIGKLRLPSPPSEWIPDRIRRGVMSALPVTHSHALRVAELPPHHKDPFDRVLIAQAQVEGLTLLTSDRRFRLYDVEVLWAN